MVQPLHSTGVIMIRSSVVLGVVAAIIICAHFVLNATNNYEMTGTIPEPTVHPFLYLAVVIIMSIIVVCIIFSEGNNDK
jgi:hypothetical protein